jgi:hypothetical protein
VKSCGCGGSNENCAWCYGTGMFDETLIYAFLPNGDVEVVDQSAPTWWTGYTKSTRFCHDIIGPALTDAELERLRLRGFHIAALPKCVAEARSAAVALDDARLKTTKSARVPEEEWGPFLSWHYGPPSAMPAMTFAVDSPKLGILIAHQDRVLVEDVHGSFCGQRIVGLDELGMEVDVVRETQRLVDSSSGTSIPAEILPGEERCADGIIRRVTTTEAMGYDVYHNQEQIEAGQQHVGLAEARKAAAAGAVVYWRPNRATTEVYTVGTELPCLSSEPEPFALIKEAV